MSARTRHPRRWSVTLHVTDRPLQSEAYMSSKEVFGLFDKLSLPAGVKIHKIVPKFVPENVAKAQGAK